MRRSLLPLAALLGVAASAQPQVGASQTPCSDRPDGWPLRACLRAAHAPASVLSAESATAALVSTVDVRVRRDSTRQTDSTFVEADSAWTVESWWEVTETPSLAAIDDTTTAHAPGALPPGWTVHTPERVAEPLAHVVGTPLPADALPTPVDGHLDLHAAWPSASGGAGLEDRRGDVARAALYVRTVYPLHVEASGEWPASAHARGPRVEQLLADHEADPPDDWERERHGRASAGQGNLNPFVLSPALARRAFPLGPRVDREAPPLWVNEVHATNDGRDAGEGVEVAGPAHTDLAAWRLVLYGGRGHPYDPYDDFVLATPALSGALPAEGSLGAAWLPVRGMWNRCNGVALFDPDAALVQFVSYGGCRFNASTGPVADAAETVASGASDPAHPDSLAWTTPTLGHDGRALQEWTQMPVGLSLQLTGAGSVAADFAWGGPHPASPGRLNDYQAPAMGANGRTARTAPSTPSIYPDLTGRPLLTALAADYSPATTFSYDRARDSLFAAVWREPREDTGAASDSLRGFYSGLAIALPRGVDPTTHAWNSAPRFSTEHLWPQSRGAVEGTPLHADLHGLAPVRQSVNSSRSNHPLGEVPDAQVDRWYGPVDGYLSSPPGVSVRDAYSKKRGGASPLFEPREGHAGDAARALFYAWTVYGPYDGPLDEGRLDVAFWEDQLPDLLAWHVQDPPHDAERQRSATIAAWQGTENPFVLDPTLAERAFAPRPTETENASAPALSLSLPRPNPARGPVSATLTLPRPGPVRVVVHDALGREVLVAHDGPAPLRLDVRLDTSTLGTGVYTLRALTSVGAAVRSVVVVR
ncbi:endonuclease [Rubrivirga marina]|uniref:Secretion system C-terminal sorting domain-containing protein n=1 Tax=Rubrivirga marina TaxID=1196024 RepID=A0A271ISE4_9BACT|nr:endonuclease [Rubrivirga marina]PAP74156.1 hypothetical protein BSZ37_21055 [Rubrivirga marina]